MDLLDFFSREAGQRRRQSLEDGIAYFVPPELRGLLGLAADVQPVRGFERAGQGAERVVNTSGWDRVQAIGDTLSEMAGVAAPVAAAKAVGMPAVRAVQEGLLGLSATPEAAAVRDFVADESGALPLRAYHGSPDSNITEFRTHPRAAWFAVDEPGADALGYATDYARRPFEAADGTGRVYEVGIRPEGVLDAAIPEDRVALVAAIDKAGGIRGMSGAEYLRTVTASGTKRPHWGAADEMRAALEPQGINGVLVMETSKQPAAVVFNPSNIDMRGYDAMMADLLPQVSRSDAGLQSIFDALPDVTPTDPAIQRAANPFLNMTRDEFLGSPRITGSWNASDLKPKALIGLEEADAVDFPVRGLKARYDDSGAAVYDGDKVVASYNFGDTLVVDPKYRKKGIAEELVYQWRTRYPGPAIAKTRTPVSQRIQENVWQRIQRELAGERQPQGLLGGN